MYAGMPSDPMNQTSVLRRHLPPMAGVSYLSVVAAISRIPHPIFAFNRSCTSLAFSPLPDFITSPTNPPSAACLPPL